MNSKLHPLHGVRGQGDLEQLCILRFAFSTGAGFKIIRQIVLPFDLEKQFDLTSEAPRINEANEKPLDLREVVWLTAKFGNTLIKVRFLVEERLAADLIVRTAVINKHIASIICREQKNKFTKGTVQIVGQGNHNSV